MRAIPQTVSGYNYAEDCDGPGVFTEQQGPIFTTSLMRSQRLQDVSYRHQESVVAGGGVAVSRARGL